MRNEGSSVCVLVCASVSAGCAGGGKGVVLGGGARGGGARGSVTGGGVRDGGVSAGGSGAFAVPPKIVWSCVRILPDSDTRR